MRFYQGQTELYCGVDLHARNMYICVVDREGNVLKHRSLRCRGSDILRAIKPNEGRLTVAVECIYAWYWLADLCHQHAIPFVLGHVLYMKAIHGAKVKNDRIDSEKISRLTAGGLMAYVYPRENRSTRDLLRRRLRFVRQRAELHTHTHHLSTQAQLTPVGNDMKAKTRRNQVAKRFDDDEVRLSVKSNTAMIIQLDKTIGRMEKHILKQAKDKFCKELAVLQTIPGVGIITALTILYEINTINRFATLHQFGSYARLVKCRHESDGKPKGTGGKKISTQF